MSWDASRIGPTVVVAVLGCLACATVQCGEPDDQESGSVLPFLRREGLDRMPGVHDPEGDPNSGRDGNPRSTPWPGGGGREPETPRCNTPPELRKAADRYLHQFIPVDPHYVPPDANDVPLWLIRYLDHEKPVMQAEACDILASSLQCGWNIPVRSITPYLDAKYPIAVRTLAVAAALLHNVRSKEVGEAFNAIAEAPVSSSHLRLVLRYASGCQRALVEQLRPENRRMMIRRLIAAWPPEWESPPGATWNFIGSREVFLEELKRWYAGEPDPQRRARAVEYVEYKSVPLSEAADLARMMAQDLHPEVLRKLKQAVANRGLPADLAEWKAPGAEAETDEGNGEEVAPDDAAEETGTFRSFRLIAGVIAAIGALVLLALYIGLRRRRAAQ